MQWTYSSQTAKHSQRREMSSIVSSPAVAPLMTVSSATLTPRHSDGNIRRNSRSTERGSLSKSNPPTKLLRNSSVRFLVSQMLISSCRTSSGIMINFFIVIVYRFVSFTACIASHVSSGKNGPRVIRSIASTKPSASVMRDTSAFSDCENLRSRPK